MGEKRNLFLIEDQLNYDKVKVINEIRNLIKERYYFAALQICSQDKFFNDVDIQAERLFILIRYFDNYEAAYKIWEHYKDVDDAHIITRGMDILAKLYSNEDALDYCNQFDNDDIHIVRKKVRLLYKLGRYEEARKICSDERYSGDEAIYEMRLRITDKIGEAREAKIELITDSVSDYLTRIYIDDISLEEIENSDLEESIKKILLIAYYEKNNTNLGLKIIKELKSSNTLDYAKRKMLNALYDKFNSKKAKNKIFDITIYGKLLGRNIDSSLVIEHNMSKKEEEEKEEITKEEIKALPVEKKKKKKVGIPKKMVTVGGGITNSRYNRITNNISSNNNSNKVHVTLIKDVLSNEIEDINLYIAEKLAIKETKAKAVKAWDNLQILINRPITDLDSVVKIIDILISLNKDNKELVDMYNKKLEKIIK